MTNQFSSITKPVIIMPFHFNSAVLYHAMKKSGVNVLGFWDNNKTINGENYDGKSITPPVPAEKLVQDVTVIIYYKKYEGEIRNQLETLGYSDFVSAHDFDRESVNKRRVDVCEDDLLRIKPEYKAKYGRKLWLDENKCLSMRDEHWDKSLKTLFAPHSGRRKILIISPNIGVTGAVIALQHAARAILKNGDMPLFFCQYRDCLLPDFLKDGVPVLIDYKLPEDTYFEALASRFDMVLVNTITPPCVAAIEKLNRISIPVLWWIHEPKNHYTTPVIRAVPKPLGGNIHVYCAAGLTQSIFSSQIPDISSEILLLGMEDLNDEQCAKPISVNNSRLNFMIIGGIQERKGHDIFCSAIRLMNSHSRDKCNFYFVGCACDDTYNDVLALKSDFPESVTLTGEVGREEIKRLLNLCDCMVCSSRDEPLGIFIIEAMMFHTVCICSENAGISDFIEDGVNGFVYTQNSAEQLRDKMEYVVRHFGKLDDMRAKSRDVYDDYFAINIFRHNLLSIIDKLTETTI